MPEPKYHSYLIRLWQEDGKEKTIWRFVLVDLIEGQQWGFANLERLVAFLKEQVDALSLPDSANPSDSQDRRVGNRR